MELILFKVKNGIYISVIKQYSICYFGEYFSKYISLFGYRSFDAYSNCIDHRKMDS